MYQLSFDLPVSVNQMYRRTRHGVSLTNDAAAWKTYAQVMAVRQWELDEPLKGALAVTYYFHGSKLDIDNGLKLLNDACNKIIWKDDRQLIEIHVYIVSRKSDDPHVTMEIKEL